MKKTFAIPLILLMCACLLPIANTYASNTTVASSYDIAFIQKYAKNTIDINDVNACGDLVYMGGYLYMEAEVYTPRSTSVQVYVAQEEASNVEYINSYFRNYFSEATYLSTATISYNCHSYAWYSTAGENWMNDPSAYYSDYSYVEVSEPAVGDIICYFDSDGNNLHSGVVVELLSGEANDVCEDANLCVVESKWGQAPLFRHHGDYCPYVSTYGGSAVEVRYYRIHSHSYTYTWYSLKQHKVSCECGYSYLSSHVVTAPVIGDSKGYVICISCGGKASEWSIITSVGDTDR